MTAFPTRRAPIPTADIRAAAILAAVILALVAAGPATPGAAAAKADPSPSEAAAGPGATDAAAATGTADDGAAAADTGMALAGDSEGTVFGSLTVEGENRIQVEFERPALDIDIDPQQAPGLEWGDVVDVLDRSRPDLVSPLLALSATAPSPFLPRPWLDLYRTGPVARFRPAVREVAEWRLAVVDSHGEEVASFTGDDDPPEEIAWDGATAGGEPAQPGLTYSYVFEARDRAGNRRRFVGDGFQVPPYRTGSGSRTALLVSGTQLGGEPAGSPGRSASAAAGDRPGPYVLEAASRLAMACGPSEPIVVRVTARSFEEASALGDRLERQLGALLPGDPARLTTQARVEPGAPVGGTVLIAAGGRD